MKSNEFLTTQENTQPSDSYSSPLAEIALQKELLDDQNSAAKINLDEIAPDTQAGMLNHARRKAEAHLQENMRLLSLFARDSSLRFQISTTASTFAFYPEENMVMLPESWFDNDQYNDSELRWAQYHELAHFIDMRKNPEAFLDNFKQMQNTAKQLTTDYQEKFPNANRSSMEQYFYEQIHTLYNCLDDIYVNNLVGIKAPVYHSGEGVYDVTNIYRKVGYAEPNLTSIPAHQQLAYSLLRDEMVGKQLGLSQVSEQVEAELSKRYLGRNIREIINQNLKPRPGLLVDPEQRYKTIRAFIEPAYISLLKQALDQTTESPQDQPQTNEREDSQFDNASSSQAGEMSDDQSDDQNENQTNDSSDNQTSEQNSSQADDFDPFNQKKSNQYEQNFLDSADEEVIKQILESLKEQDRVDNLSPSERQDYLEQQKKEQFDKEHQIDPKVRQEYEEIVSSIGKTRREMREFWKNLIGKSIEYQNIIHNKQRRGRLDVKEVINQFPELLDAQRSGKLSEKDLYKRHQLERIIVDQPESIEISLLLDTSGSMRSSNKLQAAKQTATLLMLSIKDFNTHLNQTRRQTGSRLRANTQIITYGDYFEEIKPFEKKVSFSDNEVNIIKAISKIIPDGTTNDTAPLMHVSESLLPEQLSKINHQKLKKLVFLVTDGASDKPNNTKQIISELVKKGVLVFGFQIGDVNYQEKATFNYIWNSDQHTNRGIYVGNQLDQLPKELLKALTNSLKGIRL